MSGGWVATLCILLAVLTISVFWLVLRVLDEMNDLHALSQKLTRLSENVDSDRKWRDRWAITKDQEIEGVLDYLGLERQPELPPVKPEKRSYYRVKTKP